MIIVALLECKSGAIATNDACLAQLFIAHFFPQPYNQLHINALSLHAQNSRISHQRFLSALNEEYWVLEMQILCQAECLYELGRALPASKNEGSHQLVRAFISVDAIQQ